MIEEALSIKKFIEESQLLNQPNANERNERLKNIEMYLKGMTDTFEEDVRSIASEVVEQALKSLDVHKNTPANSN